jgi:hypothetical protein
MECMATNESSKKSKKPLQEEQEAAPRRARRPLQERGTQNPEKFNGEEWLNIGIN